MLFSREPPRCFFFLQIIVCSSTEIWNTGPSNPVTNEMSRGKQLPVLTPPGNNHLPYLPPSSLVSRHAMTWMSCWEMNSLVMTSSSWLKSALCSSDRTGTDFRYLSRSSQRVLEDEGDNVAQRTSTTETPISQSRLYKKKAYTVKRVQLCHIGSSNNKHSQSHLISCKPNNRHD